MRDGFYVVIARSGASHRLIREFTIQFVHINDCHGMVW